MILTGDSLKTLDDLVRTDLQDIRQSFFVWLLISTAVVALGVLLEGPELLREASEEIERFRFKSLHRVNINLVTGLPIIRHRLNWRLLLEVAGWLLIGIGVVGEFGFEIGMSKYDKLLQSFDSILIAEARTEAIAASASAESATALAKGYDKQIAEAGRDAAKARSDAAKAELARAKLEKEISPRTLDDKHRKASGERLKPFAANFSTRKITVLSYILDAEGIIFSLEIMDVLFRAGIKAEPVIGREIPAGIPNMGVRITGPVKDKVFIETLAKEINVAADTPVDGEDT
jgi:hypothetical protein